MLNIYLARHGQDQDNAAGILNGRRDTPLTDKGQQQAAELAQKIKETGLTFDATYSSPLTRAKATATAITQALGLPEPIELDGLIERSFGVMTGQPQKDIELLCAPEILKTDTITYFLSPEGAETFPELLGRANLVLRQIQEAWPAGKVLLVTHGDFGKMLYAAYYSLDWKRVLEMFHFGNSELLLLSPASGAEETHVFTAKQYNH